jgi:uncharacterized membrane protein
VSTNSGSGPAPGGAVRAWSVAYFAVTSLVLLALVTKAQTKVLPEGLATRVGHNSEVFALAILVTAAILARRRIPPAPAWVHVAVAVGLAAVGVFIFYAGMPVTVKTLNEPVFAGAALWLYVLPRRPIPKVWLISVALIVVVAVGYNTSLITLQAENLVALILAPLVLDVTDRRLLDPSAPDLPALRWAMIVLLILVPVVLIAFLKSEPLPGVAADFAKYCSRATEAFWGLALVDLFFVVRFRLERNLTSRHRRSSARRP